MALIAWDTSTQRDRIAPEVRGVPRAKVIGR